MDQLRIKIVSDRWQQFRKHRMHPIVQHLPQLETLGITIVTDRQDLTVIDTENLWANPALLDVPGPIVLHEIADQSSLARHVMRTYLERDNISIVKAVDFRDPLLHNADVLCHPGVFPQDHQYHCLEIYEANKSFLCSHGIHRVPVEPPILGEDRLSKIHLGFSIFNHPQVEDTCRPDQLQPNLYRKRSIDISCAGAVGFYSLPITLHRHQAASKVLSLQHKRKVVVRGYWDRYPPGMRWKPMFAPLCEDDLSPAEYYRMLLDCKIVVSPWGIGEACYKDFEAMYAGCVLVKPKSDFCLSWPDVYQSSNFYIPCAVDFSDLEAVTDRILSHWDDYYDMRVQNIDRLKQARRDFPHFYAGLLRRLASKCASR